MYRWFNTILSISQSAEGICGGEYANPVNVKCANSVRLINEVGFFKGKILGSFCLY